jgi:DNA-binding SARP family transcriptional activator
MLAVSRLYLLGSPRIERDGALVEVDTRKALALLAYLAATEERHMRDALAALLWPEYDQSRARAALRRTLSVLRKAIGEENLAITREAVGLQAGGRLWIDLVEFRRQVAESRTHAHTPNDVCATCLPLLAKAAELYRDDFLAGFTLRDSSDFDEWQYFQSETLRRELAGILEKLVRGYANQGEFEAAIACSRRWLALDQLREEAHRALMQTLAWDGQREAALRQYRECVRILGQELGVAPLEETTQLYQLIKENRLSRPATATLHLPAPARAKSEGGEAEPAPATPDRPKGQPLYPLVGRNQEWAELEQAYERVGQDGYFVALVGEAGIGKSRLAEEFLAAQRAKGARVLTARCYEGEADLAYGPFVEAMRAALATAEAASALADVPPYWLSEAARLLPEVATLYPELPPAPRLDGPGGQSRFFAGMAQVLVKLSAAGSPPVPGVLFLDDLQWADAASLELLTYLARRLHGRPLFILATWRDDNGAGGDRLRQLAFQVERAGSGRRLSLLRLDQEDVARLVHLARAALPEGFSRRLHDETEGLPFFIIAYLDSLGQETGEAWPMPSSMRDLLHARLAAVDETGWQLLQTAAVIGRSFAFETLRTASGRSDEETITALEALVRQGLTREISQVDRQRETDPGAGQPQYDFSHEKLRALVYEETSLARRRLLHRRVADALVSQARRPPEVGGPARLGVAGQVAHHYRLAGQEAQAADYFRQAGEQARSLFANREALAHLQAALAMGHPEAAVLHEAIGDLHTLLGEYGKALATYETAAALSTPEEVFRLEHKIGRVYHRRGEWEAAERHFQAAQAALPEGADASGQARLYADWSHTAQRQSRAEEALALARHSLELAQTVDDRQSLAQAHNILGILARGRGDLAAARTHLEHSLALAQAFSDPSARVAALNNLALVHSLAGEVDQAYSLLEEALALCAAQGDRHREAALHNNLADLLHHAGRKEAAMAHLKQAVMIYAQIGLEADEWQPEIWKLTEW